jgi:hypothetical protein
VLSADEVDAEARREAALLHFAEDLFELGWSELFEGGKDYGLLHVEMRGEDWIEGGDDVLQAVSEAGQMLGVELDGVAQRDEFQHQLIDCAVLLDHGFGGFAQRRAEGRGLLETGEER